MCILGRLIVCAPEPSNLLLDKAGSLKISDFGLSHVKRKAAMETGAWGICGTPVYMVRRASLFLLHKSSITSAKTRLSFIFSCAVLITQAPEVISNKPYGSKSDIFSFGIVVAEMLICRYP